MKEGIVAEDHGSCYLEWNAHSGKTGDGGDEKIILKGRGLKRIYRGDYSGKKGRQAQIEWVSQAQAWVTVGRLESRPAEALASPCLGL